MSQRQANYTVKRERFSSTEIKKIVWLKTDGKCWYCGKQTHPFGKDRDSFQVDHFISISHGGTNDMKNLVPSCGYCNGVKKDYPIEDVRRLLVGIQCRFYFEKLGSEVIS